MPRRYARRTRRPRRIPRRSRRYGPKRRRGVASVPRALQPRSFRFKRDLEETIQIRNDVHMPEGWSTPLGENSIYRQFGWSLASLGAHDEYTNLFKQYRLKGARVRMFFSMSDASAMGSTNKLVNNQILCRMATNQSGVTDVLDRAFWMQCAAKKYKTCLTGGRPLDIYMPLKQENMITSSTGNAPTMKTPGWVPTASSNIVHYGINLSLERVDGQPFVHNNSSDTYIYCKFITTLYLECRGQQ